MLAQLIKPIERDSNLFSGEERRVLPEEITVLAQRLTPVASRRRLGTSGASGPGSGSGIPDLVKNPGAGKRPVVFYRGN